jgi:hypothetical protein
MRRIFDALILVGIVTLTGAVFLHQGRAAIRSGSTHPAEDPLAVYAAPLLARNTRPSIENIQLSDDPIDEGRESTLSFDIVDPDSENAFDVEITWTKNGKAQKFKVDADNDGTTEVSRTKRYRDDKPSGTPSDEQTITIRVTERGGGNGNGNSSNQPSAEVDAKANDNGGGNQSDKETTTIEIRNVDPTLPNGITNNSPVQVKKKFTLKGQLQDDGAGDTFTATVEWGDGRTKKFKELSGEGETLELKLRHRYKSTGTFEVFLTIKDDDQGEIPRHKVADVTVQP